MLLATKKKFDSQFWLFRPLFCSSTLVRGWNEFFSVSSVEGGEWRWFSVYSFAPSRSLDVIWIVILIIVILLVGLLITLQQLLHFMIPKLLIVFHLRRNEWRACCGIREGMRKSGSVSKSIWVSRHKKRLKSPFHAVVRALTLFVFSLTTSSAFP